jgi:hypothetical protein
MLRLLSAAPAAALVDVSNISSQAQQQLIHMLSALRAAVALLAPMAVTVQMAQSDKSLLKNITAPN